MYLNQIVIASYLVIFSFGIALTVGDSINVDIVSAPSSNTTKDKSIWEKLLPWHWFDQDTPSSSASNSSNSKNESNSQIPLTNLTGNNELVSKNKLNVDLIPAVPASPIMPTKNITLPVFIPKLDVKANLSAPSIPSGFLNLKKRDLIEEYDGYEKK